MIVNLISDTVTKPTEPMLKAMMAAEVGDDVFRQDPTVNALESRVAAMFGHEDALFCPSGTMTNQIAVNLHTQPLDEIICDKTSHVYLYEVGGYSFNSQVSVALVEGRHGIMQAGQVETAIRPVADWYPRSSLVVIENSCNRAGGTYYTLEDIRPIREVCVRHGMKLHLDGARLFNVLVETNESPLEYGDLFDSVSICLSKGLGAPVGSVLTGSREMIGKARKVRKVMGGGMRQAGYLAAAGIYALDHHIERLTSDNKRARQTADMLTGKSFVAEVLPARTNIVIFTLRDGITPALFLTSLEKKGILAAPMSHDTVRFVFHLDIDELMMERLSVVLDELDREYS